jgi:hypothetical protein
MAYITLAEFKLYKRITSTDASDDSEITALIDQACAIIDENTHRTFEASTNTTRYFDALKDVEGATLFLDRDLCSINTVTNGDGVVVSSNSYVTAPRNDTPYFALTLKSSTGLIWTYATDPENAIAISGKWAYSTSANNEVKAAASELTAWLYNRRHSGAENERMITADGLVIDSSEFPHMVRAFFERMVKRF